MKVGIFSVIEWNFLDQRPQVIAKKLAEWGHSVTYLEPFFRLKAWSDNFNHQWNEYESCCWSRRVVHPGVEAIRMLWLPAHKSIEKIICMNNNYIESNRKVIESLGLDLAIVIDPSWSRILYDMKIPFIYDHVDDTHQMEAVLKDFWYEEQCFSADKSIATLYIQSNIAKRNGGLYVPNGIDTNQLNVPEIPRKDFDAGCLSAIADWFDIDSVLNTSKKILIIGPMDLEIKKRYDRYRHDGKNNVTWLPRVPRTIAAHWLKRCKTAIIPFDDLHPIVDYVMPLKLVEYLYLGLPTVTYLNKGIEEEFGDMVTFYSSVNWKGLPSLDAAIDRAIEKAECEISAKEVACRFTWDNVFEPLKNIVSYIENGSLEKRDIESRAHDFCNNYEVELVKNRNNRRNMTWFFAKPTFFPDAQNIQLPPYLELYFTLFQNQFSGDDNNEKKLAFLTWLVTHNHDVKVISAGKGDPYIFEILDAPHKSNIFVNGLHISNFEHTFLRINKNSFSSWGYSDTSEDLERKIAWLYTWGYSSMGGAYYEHAIKRYLDDSDGTFSNGFISSKILLLLIHCHSNYDFSGYESPNKINIYDISNIIFNYKALMYPLTKIQISQLVNSSELFLSLFSAFSKTNDCKLNGLNFEEIDCHPLLKEGLSRSYDHE